MSNHRHGYSKSLVYGVWAAMLSRCNNPSVPAFSNYGGRGITVCDAWTQFPAFLADMGEPAEGMTLDRIDNSKGYNPENCRWTDRHTQARNRRGRRMITANGETLAAVEWAERMGVSVQTLCRRLDLGWEPEAAVNTPIMRQGKAVTGARHGVRWSEPMERAA